MTLKASTICQEYKANYKMSSHITHIHNNNNNNNTCMNFYTAVGRNIEDGDMLYATAFEHNFC